MPMPEFQQIVNEAKKEIQEIDVPTLKKMQQAKEDFDLIDVRETDEYQRGAIPGAKHISRGVLERDIDQVTTDKSRKIVLYCGGGSRSALGALNLKKMGFKNANSLAGWWGGWRQSKCRRSANDRPAWCEADLAGTCHIPHSDAGRQIGSDRSLGDEQSDVSGQEQEVQQDRRNALHSRSR